MLFVTPNTAAGATSTLYVDLSQVASLMNRRFYRQGLNWAVAGFKFITPPLAVGQTAKSSVVISKLPNTWVLANSWKKSLAVWTRMNNEALEENEGIRPRFLDFKVYADDTHHTLGYGANLLPSLYTAGEWEASKIVMPDFDFVTDSVTRHSREFIAVGPSYPGASASSGFDAVSMIEGYASSRLLPNVLDPNAPADAVDTDGLTPENWMTALFNDGQITDTAIIEDMITENNISPYPFENDGVNLDTMYPGGANQSPVLQPHDVNSISGTTIGGTTRLKGGNFPCGLIRLDHIVSVESISHGLTMIVDLIPGNHRGYLAESMQEM